jgi:hypothetical protein
MNRAESVDWWRAFLPAADDLVAAGPVKTSASRRSADRKQQARRRRAWFKRA